MVERSLCFYLDIQLFYLSICAATVVSLTVSSANINLLHASARSHTHHTLGTRNPSQSCSFVLGLNANTLCISVGVVKPVEVACAWRVFLGWLGVYECDR